ncbi:large ribosomal subunit protein bL12m-like isoform X1 [Dysidea avara]|uniref:large ribosomal subunit protein bL12m-like isoform X1 n=1 Tax=Dysidea avara TaxID=196820 RepID=UPI003321874F
MNHLRTLRPVLMQLRTLQYTCRNTRRLLCAASEQPLPIPQDDTTKNYSQNIQRLAEDISQLTLLETSQLNELLKSKLNIQDVPMMAAGVMPAAAGTIPEDEKEEAPKEEQTKFTVKLLKFDDGAKIKLIKEIKGIIEGVNLVQAKKFVEELPQTVKQSVSKEDAAALKERLEAAGGVVEID